MSNNITQKNEKKETKKTEIENIPVKSVKKKVYFSFTTRFVFNLFMFLVFVGLFNILFYKTFTMSEMRSVNYKERGNIDYKVYLKENDLYEQEFLDKNMSYVSNLIKYIKTDFNYTFDVDSPEEITFDYDIMGKIVIKDDNNNVYFEKEYTLFEGSPINSTNKTLTINKSLDIDYEYYNNIANTFKDQTGVTTNSNLITYLRIKKHNTLKDSNFKLNNNTLMYINIPLSEKAININMDYKEINSNNVIIENENISVKNDVKLILLDVVSFLFMLFFLINVVKLVSLLFTKNSAYDKYIKKLLNDYDRLIAVTDTYINLTDYNVIMIHNFNELLDIRDNLKVPIFYYNLQNHIKSYFYIKDKNDLYLVIIKACDMDKTEKHK